MVHEGSLLLTGQADPESSRAGGAARKGESTSARDRAGGRVGAFFLEGAQERRTETLLEVGGGRALGHVGESNVETTTGLE